MYIQSTQKLLSQLGCFYEKLSNPPQPLYCWHATVFEFHGRAHIVMLNDASEFILFFQVAAFSQFEEQVREELAKALKGAGLSSDQVEAYRAQMGPIRFGPTAGPSSVGRLNNQVRRVRELASRFDDSRP